MHLQKNGLLLEVRGLLHVCLLGVTGWLGRCFFFFLHHAWCVCVCLSRSKYASTPQRWCLPLNTCTA